MYAPHDSVPGAHRKTAPIASFEAGRTQSKQLARIFTVDFAKCRGLNKRTGFPIQSASHPRSRWNKRDLPGDKMNKADLINRIAAGSGISKAQAATAIDTAVDSITASLKKGDRVALIGFGTFSISQRKARNGRNPQTGATIKIAARRVAKFTPGAELKKAVNRGK
jgi:DNA-binding protein HU-beta